MGKKKKVLYIKNFFFSFIFTGETSPRPFTSALLSSQSADSSSSFDSSRFSRVRVCVFLQVSFRILPIDCLDRCVFFDLMDLLIFARFGVEFEGFDLLVVGEELGDGEGWRCMRGRR